MNSINSKNQLNQLLENHNKIEYEFYKRLEYFDQQIGKKDQELLKKEKQLDILRKLFIKEKKQKYSSDLLNKGALERKKRLNQKLKNLKFKIKKVYQKLDGNNDRLTNVIDLLKKNKQTGGGEEVEIMKYLDQIENELKENIGRINFVEKELKDFLAGKDVELEKISESLDQLLPNPKKEEENKNYDIEAKKILQNIDNIEKKLYNK